MPRPEQLAEPWRSFFAELDSILTEEVRIHCCGGFVLTQLYGLPRATNDVDFLSVVPNVQENLIQNAGKESALRKKHKVYLDNVTVATPPEDYRDRLLAMFPHTWSRLQLFALEAHDLALSKLERNSDRDREDVQYLARLGHLRPETLRQRYYSELRPNLVGPEDRHDLTLKLWLEAYW